MARERVLNKAVSVTVEIAAAKKNSYDTVRFETIRFNISGSFKEQHASFQWAIGRVVPVIPVPPGYPIPEGAEMRWERGPASEFSGTKFYDNSAPNYAFATLISKSPTLALAQDSVFADLEAEGMIPAGTNRDYSLYPPGYKP